MTAEQKAKELIKKFNPHVYCYSGSSMLTNDPSDSVILMMSKRCAVLAVEHTVERLKAMYLKNYANTVDFKATSAHSDEINFLKEILVEIDNVKLEEKV